jgi:hypothetical protein
MNKIFKSHIMKTCGGKKEDLFILSNYIYKNSKHREDSPRNSKKKSDMLNKPSMYSILICDYGGVP